MPENCGTPEMAIPPQAHVWRRAEDDGTFVYDHDAGTFRPPTNGNTLHFEVDRSRTWRPKLKELSVLWAEHVLSHEGGSVADAATEKYPIVFECETEAAERIGYGARHTPEIEEQYPFCAHTSILEGANTPGEHRD